MAETAYDLIRHSDSDVRLIAESLAGVTLPGGTRVTTQLILDIKNHLFVDSHVLPSPDGNPGAPRQFDANRNIAEALVRLAAGMHLSQDLTLLAHEVAEMQALTDGAPDYAAAHDIAQSQHPWSADIPPSDRSTLNDFLSNNGNPDPATLTSPLGHPETERNRLAVQLVEEAFPGIRAALSPDSWGMSSKSARRAALGSSAPTQRLAAYSLDQSHKTAVRAALRTIGQPAVDHLLNTKLNNMSHPTLVSLATSIANSMPTHKAPTRSQLESRTKRRLRRLIIKHAHSSSPDVVANPVSSIESAIGGLRFTSASDEIGIIRNGLRDLINESIVSARSDLDSQIPEQRQPGQIVSIPGEKGIHGPAADLQTDIGGLDPGIGIRIGPDSGPGPRANLDARHGDELIDTKAGYAKFVQSDGTFRPDIAHSLTQEANRQVAALHAMVNDHANRAEATARQTALENGETSQAADRAGRAAAQDVRANPPKLVWVSNNSIALPAFSGLLSGIPEIEVRSLADHNAQIAAQRTSIGQQNLHQAREVARQKIDASTQRDSGKDLNSGGDRSTTDSTQSDPNDAPEVRLVRESVERVRAEHTTANFDPEDLTSVSAASQDSAGRRDVILRAIDALGSPAAHSIADDLTQMRPKKADHTDLVRMITSAIDPSNRPNNAELLRSNKARLQSLLAADLSSRSDAELTSIVRTIAESMTDKQIARARQQILFNYLTEIADEANRRLADADLQGPGAFTAASNELNMSPRPATFQRAVSGAPSGIVYAVSVTLPDGTVASRDIDAFANQSFVDAKGDYTPAIENGALTEEAATRLTREARGQVDVAGDREVVWVLEFADQVPAFRAMMEDNQIPVDVRSIDQHRAITAENNAAQQARSATQPSPATDGTAAAVPDSRFEGESARRHRPRSIARAIAASFSAVNAETGNPRLIEWTQSDDITHVSDSTYRVSGKNGTTFEVNVWPGRTEANDAGPRAVANFSETSSVDRDGTSVRTFDVVVSDRAQPRMVARAIAHELAEISQIVDGNINRTHLLTGDAVPSNALTQADLTPHDHGRIAELRYLTDATLEGPRTRRSTSRDELAALLTHLGLDANTTGPTANASATTLTLDEIARDQTRLINRTDGEPSGFARRLMGIPPELRAVVVHSSVGPDAVAVPSGTPSYRTILARNLITQVGGGTASAAAILASGGLSQIAVARASLAFSSRVAGSFVQAGLEARWSRRGAQLDAINKALSLVSGNAFSRSAAELTARANEARRTFDPLPNPQQPPGTPADPQAQQSRTGLGGTTSGAQRSTDPAQASESQRPGPATPDAQSAAPPAAQDTNSTASGFPLDIDLPTDTEQEEVDSNSSALRGAPRVQDPFRFAGRYAGSASTESAATIAADRVAEALANTVGQSATHLFDASLFTSSAGAIGALANAMAEWRLAIANDAHSQERKGRLSQFERDQARAMTDLMIVSTLSVQNDFTFRQAEIDAHQAWLESQTHDQDSGASPIATPEPTVRGVPKLTEHLDRVIEQVLARYSLPASTEEEIAHLVTAAEDSRNYRFAKHIRTTRTAEQLALEGSLTELGLIPPSGDVTDEQRHLWVLRQAALSTPELANRIMKLVDLPSGIASVKAYTYKGLAGQGTTSGLGVGAFGAITGAGPLEIVLESMASALGAGVTAGVAERLTNRFAERVEQDRNPARSDIAPADLIKYESPAEVLNEIISRVAQQQDPGSRYGTFATHPDTPAVQPLIDQFGRPEDAPVVPTQHVTRTTLSTRFWIPGFLSGLTNAVALTSPISGSGHVAGSYAQAVGEGIIKQKGTEAKAARELFLAALREDIQQAQQESQVRSEQVREGTAAPTTTRPATSDSDPVQSEPGPFAEEHPPTAPTSQADPSSAHGSPTDLGSLSLLEQVDTAISTIDPSASNDLEAVVSLATEATRLATREVAQSPQARAAQSAVGHANQSAERAAQKADEAAIHADAARDLIRSGNRSAGEAVQATLEAVAEHHVTISEAYAAADDAIRLAEDALTTNGVPPQRSAEAESNRIASTLATIERHSTSATEFGPRRHRAPGEPDTHAGRPTVPPRQPVQPINPRPPQSRPHDNLRRLTNSSGWEKYPDDECSYIPGVTCICAHQGGCPRIIESGRVDPTTTPVTPPVDPPLTPPAETPTDPPEEPPVTPPEDPPTTPLDDSIVAPPAAHHRAEPESPRHTHQPGCSQEGPCHTDHPVGEDAVGIAMQAAIRAADRLGLEVSVLGPHRLVLIIPGVPPIEIDFDSRKFPVDIHSDDPVDAVNVTRDGQILSVLINENASIADICIDVIAGVAAITFDALGLPHGAPILVPGAAPPAETALTVADRQEIAVLQELMYQIDRSCDCDLPVLETLINEMVDDLGLGHDQPGALERRALIPDDVRQDLAEAVPNWVDPDPTHTELEVDPGGPSGEDAEDFWESVQEIGETSAWPMDQSERRP